MKHLNEIIRDLREDHDLKQSDIAGVLGTSQQYYSKYEAGTYELPVRFLIKLAITTAFPPTTCSEEQRARAALMTGTR